MWHLILLVQNSTLFLNTGIDVDEMCLIYVSRITITRKKYISEVWVYYLCLLPIPTLYIFPNSHSPLPSLKQYVKF